MRQLVVFLLGSLVTLLSASGARAQAVRIPTFCDVTAAQKEVQAGARVTFTVSLKNMKDMPVTALADTTVTLTSDSFAAPVDVVVRKGEQSATATVVMAKAGIGRVKATSTAYPPAFTIVPVRPATAAKITLPKTELSPTALQRMGGAPVVTPPPTAAGRAAVIRGAANVGRRGAAAAGAAAAPGVVPAAPPAAAPPPPPPPPQAPPEPSATTPDIVLDVQVTPDPVHPRARAWAADVVILLLTKDHLLATADRDLPLQLSTRFAQIEPRFATIRAGDSSTAATPIRLSSSESGSDLVSAVSAIARGERPILFDAPQPAKLRVAPTPNQVLSDGRAMVNVAVLLEDGDGHVTLNTRPADLNVHLESDLGDFQTDDIAIKSGESSAETTFSSRRYGTASITATSVGLDGTGTVMFFFPWLMLALSIAGGMAGSFARESSTGGRRTRRGSPIVRHLTLGAIFGLVFFALALFGAIGSIPKTNVDVGRISPLNEIGAFVLGFIGGYLGNRFWTAPAKSAPTTPA